MTATGADVKGDKELIAKLKKLAKRASGDALEKALARGAEVLEAEMKATTAWKDVTGELRRSIGTKKKGKGKRVEMTIGATAPHTHLLEMGTVKMSARPFIRPAWDANRDQVLRMVKEELERLSEPQGL